MKKILWTLAVLVLVALLAVPILNFFYTPMAPDAFAADAEADAEFAEVAHIMAGKCASCHAEGAELPFYASLPGIGGLLRHDIDTGTRYMDMLEALAPENGAPVNESALAKIEHVIEKGSMPPMRYKAVHWNAGLSDEEREQVLGWIRDVRQAHYATGDAAPEFAAEVVQPLPQAVDADPEKVALGDMMYHDKRLSADNSLSCASCHSLDLGGTDRLPSSVGIGGQQGPINSPTVFNSGLFKSQFWDGRAADLVEQAAGPVHNPIEMGSNWEEVLAKLKQDPEIVAAFEKAYEDGLTGDNIAHAIAEFEKTLITPNARFDQYLRGEEDAITETEQQGYQLFKTHGCATCHVGAALGGQSFETMGRKDDYFEERGDLTDVDLGRFNVTKEEGDKHKLKVPTLRNIALTEPYFHDGTKRELDEVVRAMGKYQLGVDLSDDQVQKIVAFLHTLTGEYKGEPLAEDQPEDVPVAYN